MLEDQHRPDVIYRLGVIAALDHEGGIITDNDMLLSYVVLKGMIGMTNDPPDSDPCPI